MLRRETAMIEDSYGGTETDQAFCRKVPLTDLIYLLSWLRKKRRKIIAPVFPIRDFISFWRCADIWGRVFPITQGSWILLRLFRGTCFAPPQIFLFLLCYLYLQSTLQLKTDVLEVFSRSKRPLKIGWDIWFGFFGIFLL